MGTRTLLQPTEAERYADAIQDLAERLQKRACSEISPSDMIAPPFVHCFYEAAATIIAGEVVSDAVLNQ